MARPPLPSYELASEWLRYDPKTGNFWRPEHVDRKHFSSDWAFDLFHRVYAGKLTGALLPHGYVKIYIGKFQHYAHRLAWLLTFGEPVPARIDHLNNVRSDNRIGNLRAATQSENLANAKKRSDNGSGIKGVSKHHTGKYTARIRAKGENIYLGLFDTREEAAKARREAAERFHGEFARHD